MKNLFRHTSIVLTALILITSSAQAQKKAKLEKRIKHMGEYFGLVMEDPVERIPPAVLSAAKGIIIMRQYKAGFVVGVKGGAGIAMVRDESDGSWSPPAFVKAGEGSFGFQIGGQRSDSVFLIMNDVGMKILSGGQFKIGVDVAATAGPHGVGAEAKMMEEEIPIFVYGSAKGLFAGAAVEGGVLLPDDKGNGIYYNNPSLTMNEILFKKKVSMPAAGATIVAQIKKYSASPAAKAKPEEEKKAEE